MRTTLLAAALATLVAAGCSDAASTRSPDPAPRTSAHRTTAEPGEPSPTAQRRMLVPLLIGLKAWDARQRLEQSGLRPRQVQIMGSACRGKGVVLRQLPRPGRRVALGSTVRIEVNAGAMSLCGAALPPAPRELERVARLFERFARGELDGPRADTPVDLLLGGVPRKELAGEQQADRSAWRMCPGLYAGRTCPFSALDVIRDHLGPLAVTPEPPRHPCAHPRELEPRELGGTYSVTITPDEGLDCTAYWAVQLVVNDVSQVVAVNLVWAEP